MSRPRIPGVVAAWTGPALCLVLVVLVSACSSRQSEAHAAAEDSVPHVVDVLQRLPQDRWTRPPAAVRQELASAGVQYRVLREGEAVRLAVWRIDRGTDPFTDDTVRTGTACARLTPGSDAARLEACPPRLAADVVVAAVDWSDASAAYETALVEIEDALARMQEAVRRGRVTDARTAGGYLLDRGFTVEPRGSDDPRLLRATVGRTARAARISDTSRTTTGTACTTVSFSLDARQPYYASLDARPCPA